MDGFTANEELQKLNEIGSKDLEGDLLKKFPKNQWFLGKPLAVPPYSQYGNATSDNMGRKWGLRREEETMLNVRLPVARDYHSEGRVIDFPESGSTIDVPNLGMFIVEDVIVPKGRRTTAKVKVQWLRRNKP